MRGLSSAGKIYGVRLFERVYNGSGYHNGVLGFMMTGFGIL
jgi:Na+-transporting NADH:ubiquinone oxidoreductase subunit NqrD